MAMKGVRVQFSGKKRAVIDGPFMETKERSHRHLFPPLEPEDRLLSAEDVEKAARDEHAIGPIVFAVDFASRVARGNYYRFVIRLRNGGLHPRDGIFVEDLAFSKVRQDLHADP